MASYLANWAIRSGSDRVLEPSFGDGVFIDAALDRLAAMGGSEQNIHAVELRDEPFQKYRQKTPPAPVNYYLRDFLDIKPFGLDVVIGNPPYVRLRNLDRGAAQKAVVVTEEQGVPMPTGGSLWMPFLVHAVSFIKTDGRLAFVLPLEMTYVKYARPLWGFLSRKFSSISLIRTHEDIFTNNEEKVVLLLADGFGGTTGVINFELYLNRENLLNKVVIKRSTIPVDAILNGQRPFTFSLLSSVQQDLLHDLVLSEKVSPIAADCKFKIGYVSGDKDFFHPDRNTIKQFNLTEANLIKAVKNSRQLRGVGVFLEQDRVDSVLYYPATVTGGDVDYIKYGEEQGVSRRYKCRVRNPWYLTPGVQVPDLLLTVFAERPLLLKNSGGYAASNSLLCGYMSKRPGLTPEDIIGRWYNSLTLLFIELQVHSLGGGVLVLIPGEADKINVPQVNSAFNKLHLTEIDTLLKAGKINLAYEVGSEYILQRQLGLTGAQVNIINDAVDLLRCWRQP